MAASLAPSEMLRNLCVLVVDDNKRTRRLVGDVLHAFGIEDVRLAAAGPEALDMIRVLPPDLVLCDWNMTPMDGITFLKALRRKDFGRGARTPAIMITAHTRPDLVKAAMDAGANHFVAKPVVPGKLLKRILWVLADKRRFVLDRERYVLAAPGAPGPAAAGAPAESVWLLD